MDLRRERVLLTGGGGFLGRRVDAQLETEGVTPTVFGTNLVDLRYQDQVSRLFTSVRPTVVFHLAARVGGIGANQKSPGSFWYDNLQMGLNIIEACRVYGVKKLIVIGTVCAYPKLSPIPFREENLFDGYPEETNAPYGIAKRSLLVGLRGYREQYGLNGIFLLPVNLYGPGDSLNIETSHVIPAITMKMLEAVANKQDRVVLWGTGQASREFLYVDDCARALVLAAKQCDGPDPVNLGTGREIRIADLAEKIASATGFTGKILWDTSKPDGQSRRCLDTQQAKKFFGWAAETSFEDGLRETVEWYRRKLDASA